MAVADQFGLLVFIITCAYIVKLVWYRENIRENSGIVMKIVFNMTLPCVVLKSLTNTHTFDDDSWLMFVGGCVYQIAMAAGGIIVFRFILRSDVPWQQMLCGCIGCNIGLFLFPILEIIDGDHAISRSVLFNLSNDFCCYFVIRPIFALLANTNEIEQEHEDIIIELKEDEIPIPSGMKSPSVSPLPMEDVNIGSETPLPTTNQVTDLKAPLENEQTQPAIIQDTSKRPEKESQPKTPLVHPIMHSEDLTRKSEDLADGQSFVPIPIKPVQKQKPSKLQLFKTIIISMLTALPVYAYPFGYIVGLLNIPLPFVIKKIITTMALGNTVLAYCILGFFFEWRMKWKSFKIVVQGVVLKMIIGLTVGLSLFYATASVASYTTRVVYLLCCLCPCALINIIYGVEYNVGHLDVSSGMVSYSNIVSLISVILVYSLV